MIFFSKQFWFVVKTGTYVIEPINQFSSLEILYSLIEVFTIFICTYCTWTCLR